MDLPISFFCCLDEEQSELKEFRVALLSLKVSMVNNDGYIRYVVAWGYSGGGMQADIQSKYIEFTKTDTRYLFIGAGDEWNNVYLKNGIMTGKRYMTAGLLIQSHHVQMKMKTDEFLENLVRNLDLILNGMMTANF